MKLHSPLPQSIELDISKCAHIIEKFSKKEMATATGHKLDNYIPTNIIANAKGVAIITIVKAGFIFSGRTGTGLVVARLPGGGWSAPSAIGTLGMGVGGQIGAELTDFVFILNTQAAVDAFSVGGNVTLGGNLSVAAGPFGRSAEAAGTVNKMAPIFSYSKTKGLFAGISIEGSVIVERKDANMQFYKQKYTPREILRGDVESPPSVAPLHKALDRQSGMTMGGDQIAAPDAMGGVVGAMAATHIASQGGPSYRNSSSPSSSSSNTYNSNSSPLQPPTYSSNPSYSSQAAVTKSFKGPAAYAAYVPPSSISTSNNAPSPSASRPPVPARLIQAVALYDFQGERESDLSFKTGDVITIIKKTESFDDWWTGSLCGVKGDFPANYVEMR